MTNKNKQKSKAQSGMSLKRRLEIQKINKIRKKRNNFPEFLIDDYDKAAIPQELTTQILKIMKNINFKNKILFNEDYIKFYYNMQKVGFHEIIQTLIEKAGEEYHTQILAQFGMHMGRIIHDELNKKGLLLKYIPYHDIRVLPYGNKFLIKLEGMYKKKSKKGTIYYSINKPEVEIEQRKYTVGFSRHAIERICERCVYDWKSYEGSGDAFAYLTKLNYFDIYRRTTNDQEQYYLILYEKCEDGFFSGAYGNAILEKIDQNKKYYFILGYCPIGIVDDYANAITMLSPGMKGTPEFDLLNNSSLSDEEKKKLKDHLQNTLSYKQLVDTNDFTTIKWFHENGIKQVIETDNQFYRE